MRYRLKKDTSKMILKKYKIKYFVEEMELSNSYVSLIVHRKVLLPKRTATMFAECINPNANVEDYFELVKI